MVHLRGKSTILWRNLIVWLVAALLIFPQIGYAQDALKEYITIPNTITDLSDVDECYKPSSCSGYQVDSSHPCFSAIDSVLFSKDQKTLLRYPNKRIASAYVIPDGTTAIDENAFEFADGLQMITLTASVTDCLEAFQNPNSSFVNFHVLPENPHYSSVDGVLYSKNQKRLLVYPRGRTHTHFSIAEGTEAIGDSAFYRCDNLNVINMPDTVSSIENDAFGAMCCLTSVEFSKGLKELGDGAFDLCTNLRDIILPEGLLEIGEQAFSEARLTHIHIPKTVQTIGSDAFSYCNLLTSVYFENKNVTIKDDVFTSFDAAAAEETFGWKGKPIVLTMYVYHGSTAEKYAVANGYAMQYLD